MANRQRSGFRPADPATISRLAWFPIVVGNSKTIFVGDVLVNSSGGGVTRAGADSGTTQVGVCVGLYDTNKIPIGHPMSAVSTKHMPISTVGWALVALALPTAIFIASMGSNTLAATDIFASADHTDTAGNTTTGVSGHVLNGTTLNTEANFRILGLVNDPMNAWGSAYAQVYVSFLESMWGQVNPTAGV